jgi:hypothetical protein
MTERLKAMGDARCAFEQTGAAVYRKTHCRDWWKAFNPL